ncbi:Magnetosome protein MamE [Desulfovibrionales bacterium]
MSASPAGILPTGPQVGIQIAPSASQSLRADVDQILARVLPAVVSVSRPGVPEGRKNAGGVIFLAPVENRVGAEASGSGVIVDDRGYALTTFQTVGKATLVKIHLGIEAGREYLADVIDIDPSCDLVLLKLRGNRTFPAVPLGNSDALQVGDVIFAVGNPFGFTGSVTMGIVSSNSRKVDIGGVRYPDLIQTDAAVNEGNDGGPLVNLAGEIVGINMACLMPDHRYSGIGFAVPAKKFAGLLSGQAR